MTSLHATRFPHEPGQSGWYGILPAPATPAILDDALTTDVTIVGGGFAGLSAARRLVQLDPTVRVILLEADRFASGPAGRNSGFMIDLPHDLASDGYAGPAADTDRAHTAMNRAAIRFAREAAAEYGMTSAEFDPCGKINGAASDRGERHNREYATHLEHLDECYEWLDTKAMRAVTGTDHYRSGVYTSGTVMLQPAAYVRRLAAGIAAETETVRLFENSAVVSMSSTASGWFLKTARGSVSTGRVIMATNGHAESFGLFRRRLLHVVTYASMSQPFEPQRLEGQPTWGLTPADPMGTTVRRLQSEEGSRIVVRTRFVYNPSMASDEHRLARIGRRHDQKFAERFPMLHGVSMAYRWGGHLCLSWNGVPAHGEIERGLFSAVCQNGLGTARGTLAGMSAAELSLDVRSPVSEYMTSMDEPRRLPPAPLTALGVGTALRWKEWRAGRE